MVATGLPAELETLMMDSIYHLDLGRSRFSLKRNGFWNRDSRKLLKIPSNMILLGQIREVRTDNEDAKREFGGH